MKLCLAIAVWMTTAASASSQTAPPDLILAHGKIITVDANDSIGEALAIRNGKIVQVGTRHRHPQACRKLNADH